MASVTERAQVWLDVDTGVDDAFALMLALKSKALNVIGVSCVTGNMDLESVIAATLKVIDACQAPHDFVVARGASQPLVEPTHCCPKIHGYDSLGDLNPPLPKSTRALSPEFAVMAMIKALKASPTPVSLICLGPLTNIAIALRVDPQTFKEKVDKIMWMGGAAFNGGNQGAWTEANAGYDPEAAHIVFTSGLRLQMYTWDMFVKVAYSPADVAALGIVNVDDGEVDVITTRSPWAKLAGRLLHREFRHWKMEEAMIGDAGAVAAVIQPESVTFRKMNVRIELQGTHTRGMTVADCRPFVTEPDLAVGPLNVEVAVDVDVKAVLKLYTETVLLS
eukprot:m.259149 g.259149  ORF g.259149 m.259149 type:complete len:334 (-) comp37622_c0_seq1:206-1207(-)